MLIKKIENQKKTDNCGDSNAGQEGDDCLQIDEYNKDKALKLLYDESVDFKNSLAHLRTQIKSLNAQFSTYD